MALRNGIWATATGLLHYVGDPADPARLLPTMKREDFSNVPLTAPRESISTFPLIFSPATDGDRRRPRIPFVRENYQSNSPYAVLMTLVAADFKSICFAAAIMTIWKTLLAVLWIIPSPLRLLSIADNSIAIPWLQTFPTLPRTSPISRCGWFIATGPFCLLHEVDE
ncbi:hypothetical protein B0T11DRAFT_320956 [Plectosphaerella cucumerina]|uniref:Uncharacterized protein n=1 Tax=Plectosphaerella cucumerina TaxID=40658 RepID=A0A8K0TBY2_9PEZI|nr:hypothetical protein B0T11DRAFT_320956 [Plectosphaerella cucumerina]